jgi:hypothetical protein
MTRPALRRFLAALAAYLVVLHAIGMGAMAAPVAEGPLLVLCSMDDPGTAPGAPDHGLAQHAPCALCGLGACAVATPPADASPALYAPPPVARLVGTAQRAAPLNVVDSARARGPPVAI